MQMSSPAVNLAAAVAVTVGPSAPNGATSCALRTASATRRARRSPDDKFKSTTSGGNLLMSACVRPARPRPLILELYGQDTQRRARRMCAGRKLEGSAILRAPLASLNYWRLRAIAAGQTTATLQQRRRRQRASCVRAPHKPSGSIWRSARAGYTTLLVLAARARVPLLLRRPVMATRGHWPLGGALCARASVCAPASLCAAPSLSARLTSCAEPALAMTSARTRPGGAGGVVRRASQLRDRADSFTVECEAFAGWPGATWLISAAR